MMNDVDTFMILDDVNFIKRGWIHRNRILCDGKEKAIILSVSGMTQNALIKAQPPTMSEYNNKSSSWGRSLRCLPWDHQEDLSTSRKLISSTAHEWYDAKHRKTSDEEVALINEVSIKSCRRCGSVDFKRNGRYSSGITRHMCNDCHRSFSAITSTIFKERKIPISEWIEYRIHLFEFHSITTSGREI